MFNLFKKKEELVLERPNTKNYPKEVLEIHHEFEIASEKLLESDYEIINSQPIVNTSKVERLKLFGFNQVKEVKESVKVIEATKLFKEQIELVQYYKQNYPFNKFITEEQVKEICHKYNLVCGDVERFRGFVPNKNLKEIESFKINDEDCLKKISSISTYGLDKGTIYDDKGEKAFRWTNIFNKIENKIPLQICAPVKDMDISGLELVEGYKLQKQHIPDPIVLQPVKGGYLIITAWGDEASDPLVVNENFN